MLAAAALLALGGCAETFYARTPTGVFSGKLDIEWIAPNRFIYRPREGDPLRYVTSDGRQIQPQIMYTDGGSIPRLFWSAPGYGPWDFGPAYVIHDWLFTQHHCKQGDWEAIDFARSAAILAEAIKTQMTLAGTGDATTVWVIYEGVSSSIARHRWDTGSCGQPPKAPAAPKPGAPSPLPQPMRIMTIGF